jgi:heme/copper-type cytochrome/quinol oxidase subunit 4
MDEMYFINYRTGDRAALLNYVIKTYIVFDLTHFPFDRQIIRVVSDFCGNVEVMPDDTPVPTIFDENALWCSCELDNWDLVAIDLPTVLRKSKVACKMQVQRKSAYYLWNVVLVVFVLTQASFSVSAVPYSNYANRMGLVLTLLLTIVAFKFVIAGFVPPTPYLTLIDKYIIAAFVVFSIVILECFFLSFYDRGNDVARAVDMSFYIILTVSWCCFHIYIVLGNQFLWFQRPWDAVEKDGGGSTGTLKKRIADLSLPKPKPKKALQSPSLLAERV